jgi:general secretion pathway protein G
MAQQKRHGFTLIELLVVMIIIGILAALVTPAIMSAMRRSKEFTIQSEMKQIEGALEKFKNEYGVYPVDFGNPYVLNDFIRQISPNQAYGDIVDETDFGNSDFWYGATLSGNRRPQTIDRAEALVVWLGGVSKNPEFPLGVLGFANGYIDDPGYTATRFFEFDETRLKDLDNDGWMEYYPASGPQNPYVYFDARTLRGTNAPDAGTVDLVRNQSVYPSIHSPELFAGQIRTDPGIPSAGKPIAAYMNTDASAFINATNAKHTYQLIAAGMDGEFGADLTGEYDYTSGTTSVRLVTNSDDSSPDLNLTIYRSHRDNITNLKDGSRLDVDN